MNVIVSDFDGVLFRRYHGLVQPVVKQIKDSGLPVFIVTFRGPDQQQFIQDTIGDALPVRGIYFADSRKKDPQTKVRLVQQIMLDNTIVVALDNEAAVLLEYNKLGVPTTHITGV